MINFQILNAKLINVLISKKTFQIDDCNKFNYSKDMAFPKAYFGTKKNSINYLYKIGNFTNPDRMRWSIL